MTALISSSWSESISLSRLLVPLSERIVLDAEEPTTPYQRAAAPRQGRRVRGSAIRAFVQWYEGELGPPRFRSLLSRLPASLSSAFDLEAEGLGIDPASWYDGMTVETLLDVLTAHLSEQRRGFIALRAARVVLRSTLSGPYQHTLRKITTPERYARSAQELWSSYYDSGQIEMRPRADIAGAICTIRRWQAHHPLLCGLNGGASTVIYEMMGKERVTTLRLACLSLGHDQCVFATTWRESSASF